MFVSDEVARLARMKGYPQGLSDKNEYVCMNHEALQEWLRNKHGLHVEILLEDNNPYTKFYFRVMKVGSYFTLSHHGIQSENYNEVWDAGLLDALDRVK